MLMLMLKSGPFLLDINISADVLSCIRLMLMPGYVYASAYVVCANQALNLILKSHVYFLIVA